MDERSRTTQVWRALPEVEQKTYTPFFRARGVLRQPPKAAPVEWRVVAQKDDMIRPGELNQLGSQPELDGTS